MTPELQNKRLRRRIGALLRKADPNAAATQAEVESALTMARALMAQHGITAEDVAEDNPERLAADVTMASVPVECGKRVAPWAVALASVATLTVGRCKTYLDRTNGTRVFYGDQEACEAAAQMYRDLVLIVETSASQAYDGAYRGRGRSYAIGFAYGLLRRIQDERKTETTLTDAPGLVLALDVDARVLKRAENWIAERTNLKNAPKRSLAITDPAAYAQGLADGRAHGTGRNLRLGGNQ